MTDEVRAAAESCRQILLHVVKLLSTHFPMHAQALHGELAGTKLTDERWARIVNLLASLRSVPGALLNDEEKECRAHGLRMEALVSRMKHAATGLRGCENALWFVGWHSAELREQLKI